VLSVHVIRHRRERWVTPDGQTITAQLPEGTRGHFGRDLRHFVLIQYHQGQDRFLDEARGVRRAALETSSWVSVDGTGARHKAKNGFCTQIGNDRFTWFGTRLSKTRLNFLDLLHAGHTDYVANDAAVSY
jgi:hypothetical protein